MPTYGQHLPQPFDTMSPYLDELNTCDCLALEQDKRFQYGQVCQKRSLTGTIGRWQQQLLLMHLYLRR